MGSPWKDKQWLIGALARHNYSRTSLAKELGCAQSTISVWVGKHEIRDPGPPPDLVPIVDEQLTIEGDAGVSSDWHAPLIHYESFNRFLDDCHRRGLRTGICAGDLTNQDALSGHEEKQDEANMEVEGEHLNYSVSAALDVFDELVISLGNHDRHHARQAKVSFQKSLRQLLDELPREKLDRITVTARDSVIVKTERGPWLVCHTRSYSRQPLAYPNRIATRHNMHIAAGHRHHHAQGKAANGKDIVELGGFQDEQRMAYVHRYTNDLPQMANGYMLLEGGFARCPMLYS